MIYIGGCEKYLSTLSLNLGTAYELFQYNPTSDSGEGLSQFPTQQLKRQLMQRYALIEKIKDEQTQVIGILIGSVVVDHYMELINNLKLTAARAGKKYYEVLIGKLNEPKLKNFQFVSAWSVALILSLRSTSMSSWAALKPP